MLVKYSKFQCLEDHTFPTIGGGPQVYDLLEKDPGTVIKAVTDCLRKTADEGDACALDCLDRLRIMVLL